MRHFKLSEFTAFSWKDFLSLLLNFYQVIMLHCCHSHLMLLNIIIKMPFTLSTSAFKDLDVFTCKLHLFTCKLDVCTTQ